MRTVVAVVAILAMNGFAFAQDAKPPEAPDPQKEIADLTNQLKAFGARIDDLQRDVDALKRVAPVTLFVPGTGTVGAVAADAACAKAKYQGAIAVRPATGGSTVLCVSIADPKERPLH